LFRLNTTPIELSYVTEKIQMIENDMQRRRRTQSEPKRTQYSPLIILISMIILVGGTNYIRWGVDSCPDTSGTSQIYQGRATGPFFTQKGGGSNYLCLPDEPEFLEVTPGLQQWRSLLYGAEYEPYSLPPAFRHLAQHNVPCAACSIIPEPEGR
jgi:hypothetical protein